MEIGAIISKKSSSNQENRKIYWVINFLLMLNLLAGTTFCDEMMSFDEYIIQYNRTYGNNSEEYEMRKNIYEERVANFSQITQFQPGVNNLTDRTPTEIDKLKGYKSKLGATFHKPRPIKNSDSFPESLDWRDQYAVTNVKNQDTCGSCWSFAAVAYLESYLILNYGYSKFDIDLSQQFVLQCAMHSSCDGGYISNALDTIVRNGITTQNQDPYKPSETHLGICTRGTNILTKGEQQTSYRNLNDEQIIALLQQSPVAISISSDDWEYAGSNGILACPQNSVIDHAVLLVGYDTDFWVIKNSWGANWGNYGYAKISRDPNRNCRIGYQVNLVEKLSEKFLLLSSMVVVLMSLNFF